MFFYVVGTHTKCIINDFAPAPRIDICIIQCHTVTNGTDLRKSPLWLRRFLSTRKKSFFWITLILRPNCSISAKYD